MSMQDEEIIAEFEEVAAEHADETVVADDAADEDEMEAEEDEDEDED